MSATREEMLAAIEVARGKVDDLLDNAVYSVKAGWINSAAIEVDEATEALEKLSGIIEP